MARHKHADVAWTIDTLPGGQVAATDAHLAVLMDIREELHAITRLARCFRIPRALDAMYELGVEARRKKRAQAKKRKTARAS